MILYNNICDSSASIDSSAEAEKLKTFRKADYCVKKLSGQQQKCVNSEFSNNKKFVNKFLGQRCITEILKMHKKKKVA